MRDIVFIVVLIACVFIAVKLLFWALKTALLLGLAATVIYVVYRALATKRIRS